MPPMCVCVSVQVCFIAIFVHRQMNFQAYDQISAWGSLHHLTRFYHKAERNERPSAHAAMLEKAETQSEIGGWYFYHLLSVFDEAGQGAVSDSDFFIPLLLYLLHKGKHERKR